MLFLGIETSCDETASAVVEDKYNVLSNVVFSSEKLHKKFGGIVPEIASREHVEKINFAIDIACKQANVLLRDIDVIAVTKGPGLIGSLLTGVTAAKWMGLCFKKPVIGVNHVQAHLFSAFLEKKEEYKFPAIGLVVSGGHTFLVYVKDFSNFNLLGTTLDDAAGEAFDKVAKLLNLGYPGGPVIEKRAIEGDEQSIKFPIGLKNKLDFSFSGLKTAVLYYIQDQLLRKKNFSREKEIQFRRNSLKINDQFSLSYKMVSDISASFQETAVKTLVSKTRKALEENPSANFLFTGGGVVANNQLRNRLKSLGEEFSIKVLFPDKKYCTDNAAMIAGLGCWQYSEGISNNNFEAVPNLSFNVS